MSNDTEQVFTGPTATPATRRRGWALNSLPAIRRRLAKVISDMDADLVDLAKGRALIYGLSMLAGILKDEMSLALDERITTLEEKNR